MRDLGFTYPIIVKLWFVAQTSKQILGELLFAHAIQVIGVSVSSEEDA